MSESNNEGSTEKEIVKEKEKAKTIRTLIIVSVIIVVLSSPLWLCGGCATIGSLLPGTDTSLDEDSGSIETVSDENDSSPNREVSEDAIVEVTPLTSEELKQILLMEVRDVVYEEQDINKVLCNEYQCEVEVRTDYSGEQYSEELMYDLVKAFARSLSEEGVVVSDTTTVSITVNGDTEGVAKSTNTVLLLQKVGSFEVTEDEWKIQSGYTATGFSY